MREKRVWPPARKEADAAETVAQFEATVAVAKQTVAKSGEVLSSAKEDLSDHQRWLQLQTAAVEKDRVRHERWLQRQREQKEAAERREEKRERRRAFYGRVWAAITGAVMAVVNAITGAIGFVVRKIAGAFAFVFRAIGRGFAFVGAGILNAARYLFAQLRFAALWLAVKLQELFGAAGAKFVAGLTFVAAALGRFGRSAARATSGAVAGASARAGALARSTGDVVSSSVSQVSAKTQAIARSTGDAVAAGVSQVSAKTQELARSTGDAVSAGMAQVSAKAEEIAAQRSALELEQTAPADEEHPISAFAERADEPNAEAIDVAPEEETEPERFRTAAQRFEQPTVYQFATARPQSFFHREAESEPGEVEREQTDFVSNEPVDFVSSEPTDFVSNEPIDVVSIESFEAAEVEEDDVEAFANPYAEFAARDETAAVRTAEHREISFGAEAGTQEGAERARVLGDGAGEKLAAAFAGIAAAVGNAGRRAATWCAALFAVASAKLHDMAPTGGGRISETASAAGSSLKSGLSGVSARARDLGQTAAHTIKPAFSGVSAKVQTAMPAFHALVSQAGGMAKDYAGAGAAHARGLRDAGRNALSLPEGVDRDKGEISRMLIVAGILMLICGALLIGSGLILRGGAPSMPTFASPFSSEAEPVEASDEVDVVWLFDDAERSPEERSVFIGAGGAGPARLLGLAFNAENWSDHTLTDFHGTVKPDLKIIDFKLAIDLVETVGPAPASPAPDTVPPRTAFRLIVPFPHEVMDGAEGVEVDDFLGDYGGLTLKVRYTVDGREKSFIQYLSPAMLKAQLAEVAGNADSLARF